MVKDEIEANEETESVTWQFITQAEVQIVNGGAILKQDGQKLRMKNLSHPNIKFTIVSLNPPPHKLDKYMENLKRIELRIPVSKHEDNGTFDIKIQLAEK